MNRPILHRQIDRDELARIYGDTDFRDALNDNTPPNTGIDRVAAASTWLCIGVALFAFWAVVGRWFVSVVL